MLVTSYGMIGGKSVYPLAFSVLGFLLFSC
jgi:hypothetical protein